MNVAVDNTVHFKQANKQGNVPNLCSCDCNFAENELLFKSQKKLTQFDSKTYPLLGEELNTSFKVSWF